MIKFLSTFYVTYQMVFLDLKVMTNLQRVEAGTNATQMQDVEMHKMGSILRGRKLWGILLQE